MYDVAIIEKQEDYNLTKNLVDKFPFAKIFKPLSNQLETIKNIIHWARTSHVWVITNDLDYRNFNFEFRPDVYQKNYIHVWNNASDFYIDYSDTFLIPVNEFKKQIAIDNLLNFKEVHRHKKLIKTYYTNSILNEQCIYDIFFVSNKEPFAEENYKHLCCKTPSPVIRINGINDRTIAFKTAASESRTDYFFSIPAKLTIAEQFPWYEQVPNSYYSTDQHYIFYALNPLNNLTYGHMAMVLYNKKLVLETANPGLDFTMSQRHIVVPILSGVSNFNLDPLITYRTAFREVIKLLYYQKLHNNDENNNRIKQWLTVANGTNSEWCLAGANDALEYFNLVNGDYDTILKTYHWQWVDNYAKTKGYKLWN